jgi:hypothetical protein
MHWTSGNRTLYNQLRNNRLLKQLRQQYYNEKKIQNLRTCDPHHWWREMKKLNRA